MAENDRDITAALAWLIPMARIKARKDRLTIYISPHPYTKNLSLTTFEGKDWVVKVSPHGTVTKKVK